MLAGQPIVYLEWFYFSMYALVVAISLNGWLVAIHASGKSAAELAKDYRLPEDYIAALLSEPLEAIGAVEDSGDDASE